MEIYNPFHKTNPKWINKLKEKNAKNLHDILVQWLKEMQDKIEQLTYGKEIKKLKFRMFRKQKRVREFLHKKMNYGTPLTEKEKEKINEFIGMEISKDNVSNETVNEFVAKYREVKEIVNKQYYIEIADTKIMKENLRVDSSDWREIKAIITDDWSSTKVKISPRSDILEYLEWDYKWEQLFTRDAAMREVENIWGVRMLNSEEWEKILIGIWWEKGKTNKEKLIKLWVVLCGEGSFRHDISNLDIEVNYWVSKSKRSDVVIRYRITDGFHYALEDPSENVKYIV